jgi:hypothetical protein
MTDNNAAIEYQDPLGNWITAVTVPNQPPLILNGMKSVAVLCPGEARSSGRPRRQANRHIMIDWQDPSGIDEIA